MQEVSGSSPLSSTLFRARVRPKVTISSHLDPARYVLSWGDFKGCPHALSAKWIARPPWRLLSRGRPRDYRPGTVRRRDRAIFPTIPVLRRHARRWPDPDRCAGATARDRSLHHRGAPPPAVRRSVEIEQTEGHRRSSCLPLTRGASLPSHTLAWSSATMIRSGVCGHCGTSAVTTQLPSLAPASRYPPRRRSRSRMPVSP